MEYTKFKPFSIVTRGRLVEYSRPVVMGILNITPDSFYDGGRHADMPSMLRHASWLADEGADIIDLGAVSSRPGAELLPPEEEAARLREAVSLLRAEMPQAVISVDTCFAQPARAAVEAGADIVNDIGGGQFDEAMFATVCELQVPYIMMHTRGLPSQMQRLVDYDDIVDDLVRYFSNRADQLYRMGMKDLWLDPGFGFAKTTSQNHELLRRLDELCQVFDEPLLVGLSRKSMIYKPLGLTPDQALEGTVALDALALERGARILRVHDPRPARQTIDLMFNDHTC
ncbi:MAG: dihydropteroate synthase [Bacteroidales bacterium]|nr:dihydropteroate synthase [Bacteroidales bacterium]MBR1785535.1 dihydropteroate synthase [Bacteroidales bacterium]